MNVKPKKESTTKPEDERNTLPDVNVEQDEDTLPRPHQGGIEGDIGSVQRPPADSLGGALAFLTAAHARPRQRAGRGAFGRTLERLRAHARTPSGAR